ncbi:MAG: LPS export ABC transporter permease LptF [Gammaproteobacteria bacterium]|nr:LPS export ABC transporter permease LptF [Gammaproteobacteria bacterium]
MLITRYIRKEVGLTFAAVALLLFAILISGTFIRILAEVAEGTYPAAMLFTIFGLKAISNLVLILPLSLFLGVLIALGKLSSESEMVVMQSCGISPAAIMNAIFSVSLLVMAAVALLTLWLTPWAEEQVEQLQDRAMAESGVGVTTAGKFQEVGEGMMLFVAGAEGEKRRDKVFLFQEHGPQIDLLLADALEEMEPEAGRRHFRLDNGIRVEGVLGGRAYQQTRFQEYHLAINSPEVVASDRRDNAIPTLQLWRSAAIEDRGELQWRLAAVVMVPLLALLAFPLSRSSPRQGSYGRLFFGILVYLIYSNLLTTARSLFEKGEMPHWIGLWWVHILVASLIVWMLQRQYGSLANLWGRKG